ncbi:MAG: TOBE domain-containing protein [Ottowia sp.]|nr:TOBE domain-containing protein [Ottowia sp.]MBK6745413.1 TOBE domain-containing protein [Ottowia sp.]
MRMKPVSARSLGYAPADKRIELLRLVGERGSISQAARAAGVSYKAAWQAIHTLTNLAGEPLVDASVGGAGGGGARLTPAGERLLEAAGQMAAARQGVLARFNDAPASVVAGPRTSMRNHLSCVVQGLHSEGRHDPVMVHLALPDGTAFCSAITRESAELLGLEAGMPVLALCKATAVEVSGHASAQPAQGGARNHLPGRVARVSRGAQRDEVLVTVAPGCQLVGFAAKPNRLRGGSRVVLAVEASAVVLALA